VTRLAAVGALAAAVALVLFAWDVRRWSDGLAAQDVRFLASPNQARYEEPPALLPLGAARRALGGEDDLAFRRTLESFARVRPGTQLTPQLLALRAETQTALAELGRGEPELGRQSRAANMTGVLALDESQAPREPEALASLITGAIGSFRNAVELDAANADAKTNLERALRIARAATLSGDAPSGGRNRGDQAGIGRTGSGY
jgi:hypothetical protein